MKEAISPEEKLLRLIRGQPKEKNKTGALALSQKETALRKLPIAQYINFLNARKVILAVFICSLIYLAASLIYPFVGPKEIKIPAEEQPEYAQEGITGGEENKPYESYLESMKSRQLFGSSGVSDTQRQQGAVSTEVIKNLTLVGIIAGDTPQAVIEDKKTQKTYYVHSGEFINDLQVEDIQEGKVTLNYQGQKFELFL